MCGHAWYNSFGEDVQDNEVIMLVTGLKVSSNQGQSIDRELKFPNHQL
jgi:hypothetical protein